MPTVQEERHTFWLCASVFKSPYTANVTVFSFGFWQDSNSFYIYLKIIVIIGMSKNI